MCSASGPDIRRASGPSRSQAIGFLAGPDKFVGSRMSYLVLARKYRPRVFSDVVGQEVATATLRGAIEEGRIGHAYLFCGPRGTGKTTTPRIFAKAWNCEQGPRA